MIKLVQSVQTGILNVVNRLSPPFVQMLMTAGGAWGTQMVYAAAKLGIADLLENGPKSADNIARETECNPDAIYRLLRATCQRGGF